MHEVGVKTHAPCTKTRQGSRPGLGLWLEPSLWMWSGQKTHLRHAGDQKVNAVAPISGSVDVIARNDEERLHLAQHVGDVVRVEMLEDPYFHNNILFMRRF